MGYYSAWPMLLILGAVLALATTPLFKAADAVSRTGERSVGLDGLRGFLALAVVFHHASVQVVFLASGQWSMPPSPLFAMLGPMAVGLFFIITGHLFWSRVLASDGRMAWMPFLVGRVFRIGPVYLVAFAAVAVAVAVSGGLVLKVPFRSLCTEVVRWLMLGAVQVPDLNGYPATSLLLCGVVWTLRYEWGFYLALPILSSIARWERMHLPMVVGALALAMPYLALADQSWIAPRALVLFLMGMCTASLHARGFGARLGDRPASVLVLLCLALALCSDEAHGLTLAVCLGVAFYFVASGCPVFGLLRMRAAQRLGAVSYGVYLVHGLVIAMLFRPEPMRSLVLASPWWSWALTACVVMAAVPLALALHVWVERPGIRLGRLVASRLQTMERSPAGVLRGVG